MSWLVSTLGMPYWQGEAIGLTSCALLQKEAEQRNMKHLRKASDKRQSGNDLTSGKAPENDPGVAPSVHDSQMSMPVSSAEGSIQVALHLLLLQP